MDVALLNKGAEGELVLTGRLDAIAAKGTEKLFLQTAERFETVTLDMEKLEYISSAGLRAIRNLYLAMHRKAGKLFVKNAGKSLMEVFELTGFAGVLNFI